MLEIKRKKNEDIDRFIRRFKTACDKYGVRHELKRNEYYQKPSEIKNIKNANLKHLKKKAKEREEKEKRERKYRKRSGFTVPTRKKRFKKGKMVQYPSR